MNTHTLCILVPPLLHLPGILSTSSCRQEYVVRYGINTHVFEVRLAAHLNWTQVIYFYVVGGAVTAVSEKLTLVCILLIMTYQV